MIPASPTNQASTVMVSDTPTATSVTAGCPSHHRRRSGIARSGSPTPSAAIVVAAATRAISTAVPIPSATLAKRNEPSTFETARPGRAPSVQMGSSVDTRSAPSSAFVCGHRSASETADESLAVTVAVLVLRPLCDLLTRRQPGGRNTSRRSVSMARVLPATRELLAGVPERFMWSRRGDRKANLPLCSAKSEIVSLFCERTRSWPQRPFFILSTTSAM